jgi:hypothetical protein
MMRERMALPRDGRREMAKRISKKVSNRLERQAAFRRLVAETVGNICNFGEYAEGIVSGEAHGGVPGGNAASAWQSQKVDELCEAVYAETTSQREECWKAFHAALNAAIARAANAAA